MPTTVASTNMNLPVPVVGVDSGPDWANNLNSCLTIIDSHNHSSGSGVQITPAGLNLSSDLSFLSNNATAIRSVRFSAQVSPLALSTDLGCLYESGVDLYYNDGVGNQVRITQSGGVAGSPGSIANLTSPASASYVSGTQSFVWQSAANTPANNDGASLILRNLSANSKGLTLSPPAAMGSDFDITLPTLPVSQSFVTINSSGSMSAATVYPLGSTGIAANGVARSNLVAVGQQVSSSSGNQSFDRGVAAADITNCSNTITTTGRPVICVVQPYSSAASDTYIELINSDGSPIVVGALFLYRGVTKIAEWGFTMNGFTAGSGGSAFLRIPPALMFLDAPAANTYVYKLKAVCDVTSSVNSSLVVQDIVLVTYEL